MTMRMASAAAIAAIMVVSAMPAGAADLAPARSAPAPLPAALPSLPIWSGFYVGAHLGGVVQDWDSDLGFLALNCSVCGVGETRSATFGGPSGTSEKAAGGVQAGYNWQSGSMVFGVEADGTFMSRGKSRAYSLSSAALISAGLGAITDPPDGFSGRFRSEADWMATARGRIGFATGAFLVYVTGGLAAADLETSASYLSLAGTPGRIEPVSQRSSSVELGWTIGAGLEAALSPHLSARAEYLYADFGERNRVLGAYINDPTALQQFVTLEDDTSFHTFRVGLNYRFQ